MSLLERTGLEAEISTSKNNRNIFEKRQAFKPFEYPEVVRFKEAIQHSYWLFSEWNYISDINDFHTKLTNSQKNIVRKTLLAISQIEVAVKKFWANLDNWLPKPEFSQVAGTFAGNEVIHADAYSHLLEILGLNADFEELQRNEAIKGRIDYLTKNLKPVQDSRSYLNNLSVFTIFVENISLFSQFLIIKSFNKNLNILKDIDNIISATGREEKIHSLFGLEIINIIKSENPSWFDESFYNNLYQSCHKALEAECRILDWIFEDGELAWLDKLTIQEFLKDRFNKALEVIGGKNIFLIDEEKLNKVKWFDEEIDGEINVDFFHKKSVGYSKRAQSVTAQDIF